MSTETEEKVEPAELIEIKKLKPLEVFTEKGCEPVLKTIAEKVKAFKPDLSTATTRKEIASFANKIARSKTLLDDMGKELVSDWKAKSKKVDMARKKIRDELDAMKAEARHPLTLWEAKEAARVEGHEKTIASIKHFGVEVYAKSVEQLQLEILSIDEMTKHGEFEEFEFAYKEASETSLNLLDTALIKAEELVKQAEELEQLKKEKEEREKKDAEEKEQEAERLRVEKMQAEEKERQRLATVKREREEAERKNKEEERIRKAKADAEKKAAEAVERADAAEKKAKEDAERAETRRLEDIKKAKEQERAKAAEKLRKEKQAAEEREADKKHRTKINNEALDAIASSMSFTNDKIDYTEEAKRVVTAIAKGEIPHVSIRY